LSYYFSYKPSSGGRTSPTFLKAADCFGIHVFSIPFKKEEKAKNKYGTLWTKA